MFGVFFIAVLVFLFNSLLVFRSGYVVGTAQGQISLIIEGNETCGNGICRDTESCSNCPADCGTCPVTPPPSGGGGGGGIITKPSEKDFFIEPLIINIIFKKGETFKTNLKIKNTENINQTFKLNLSESLKKFVYLSEDSFLLLPGQEKIIYLTFDSSLLEPEVYTEILEASSQYKTKKVQIISTIKSKSVLFDVSLEIPPDYKELYRGDELLIYVDLFNLGELRNVSVFVEYMVKDFGGNIIFKESEGLVVEDKISFSKHIKLASDIKEGDYVVVTQIKYKDSFGASSSIFHVNDKHFNLFIFIILIGIAIIIIFIIGWVLYKVYSIEHF